MKLQPLSFSTFLFLCSIGLQSCNPPTTRAQQSTTSSIFADSTFSYNETNTTAQQTRLEIPQLKDTNWFIQYNHYALEYDTAQRHSIWVAYVFHDDYNQKNVSRTDAWAFCPIIPKEYQSLSSKSQTFPGYDRGHLIASEDRVFSELANKETFYFSNMSPQLGWFNQQIWKNLETAVRKWAKDCDTLYVVTGGAINSGIEVIGKLENRNNVTIPKYYFKALVKRKGDTFDGIAFWLENKRYENSKITHEYSMTIRELEELTGINFFPNLKYVISTKPELENVVETTRDTKKWKL
ncbi:MAG: DNA/RNA non-specific endonuclease [Bacteroidales bacterium]|nr:DNA/RNA non-specific endonuclease [Bacteroidales bacterium]